jgi:hypothetical protein
VKPRPLLFVQIVPATCEHLIERHQLHHLSGLGIRVVGDGEVGRPEIWRWVAFGNEAGGGASTAP